MASCAWVGVGGVDFEVRREALPWSRIFWIWAERFGLMGVGAGGTWWSRGRSWRWREWRVVRWRVRVGVGEIMALEVGSIWRGRRVNVSSIVVVRVVVLMVLAV